MWIFIVSGVAALVLAHTAPFPFLLEFLGPERSVWHMPASDGAPTIYLTYDDGPNPAATPALLDVLAAQRVSATFFVIPRHVNELTAPIVTRMFEEGHRVALHSAHAYADAPAGRTSSHGCSMNRPAISTRLTGWTACRLFRPHAGWRGRRDVPGARSGGVHAGRLELRHVGLELVATGTAGTSWPGGWPNARRTGTSSSCTTGIMRIRVPIGSRPWTRPASSCRYSEQRGFPVRDPVHDR